MKRRAASFLLAILAGVSLILPSFATVPAEKSDGPELSAEAARTEESVPVKEAEPQSKVYLNGAPVDDGDYALIGGAYYITVRGFVSMLDGEAMVEEENGIVTVSADAVAEVVDVDGAAQADVEADTLALSAQAGRSYIEANGRSLYVEDGNQLVNGAVAVPLRVLAEVFNLDVSYDGSTGVARLNARADADAYLESGADYYDADTLYWLAHIINAESGNQPLEGKIAVGNVVMNRVADPKFPSSIYDVLFQKNQFTPAHSGSIKREPSGESWLAARLVLDGAVTVKGALFFNTAGSRTYASRNRTYVTTIGAHAFYA